MDRTYHDRITYRQQILKEHPSIALGVNDEARIRPAVEELYAFIFGTYLSIRYPSMFKIHHVNFNSGSEVMLENLITQKLISTCTSSRPTTKLSALLTTLACNVDEDFLFLLPREEVPARQDPKYLLEAYVSCCPSGFNPAEKLGRELREIHGPVPGYVEKLEASVDRFFRKLEVGRYVKRANWSVTMSAELFEPGLGTNHAHPGDEVTEFEGPVDADQVKSNIYHIAYSLFTCNPWKLANLLPPDAIIFVLSHPPSNGLSNAVFLLSRQRGPILILSLISVPDVLEMREADSTPTAKVQGHSLRLQDLHVSASADQGRRTGRGTCRCHRWLDGRQCPPDPFLQARRRMGKGGQGIPSELITLWFTWTFQFVDPVSVFPISLHQIWRFADTQLFHHWLLSAGSR